MRREAQSFAQAETPVSQGSRGWEVGWEVQWWWWWWWWGDRLPAALLGGDEGGARIKRMAQKGRRPWDS